MPTEGFAVYNKIKLDQHCAGGHRFTIAPPAQHFFLLKCAAGSGCLTFIVKLSGRTLREKWFVATRQIFFRDGWCWSRPYSGMLGSPETSRPYKWNSRGGWWYELPLQMGLIYRGGLLTSRPGVSICRGGLITSRPYKCL